MSEVYLLCGQKHIDEAISILHSALVSTDDQQQRLTVVSLDSEDYYCDRLGAQYCDVASVFQQGDYIVIRPRKDRDIRIRTQPIRHGRAQLVHATYVEHIGDFVHVVSPYYFYQDRHRVSHRKWCFHIPPRVIEE